MVTHLSTKNASLFSLFLAASDPQHCTTNHALTGHKTMYTMVANYSLIIYIYAFMSNSPKTQDDI